MSIARLFAKLRVDQRDLVPWLFRLGVALCFVGHGAFGIITKADWLPYFRVGGIGDVWAWRMMPWIGAMDITVGFLALIFPCRALFAWAAVWAVWTALLRPLAGQGWPEFFERAGNYGIPLAVLVGVGVRASWLARLPDRWPELDEQQRRRLAWWLRIVTATLLAGHAACGMLLHKPLLAHHYAAFWPEIAGALVSWVGGFELFLALAVFALPRPALLIAVCLWKVATESLFFVSGTAAP